MGLIELISRSEKGIPDGHWRCEHLNGRSRGDSRSSYIAVQQTHSVLYLTLHAEQDKNTYVP